VYCGKTAEWIWMPFGVMSGVGQGMGALDGVMIAEKVGAVLGVNVGHSHCNQWDSLREGR